jgi:mono/diheme cytochrome c family protein
MSIIDVAAGKLVNTVLLDDIDLGAATPWGVACTPDGASICVTHSGTHELSVISADALMSKLAAIGGEATSQEGGYGAEIDSPDDVPNALSFLVDIRRRIRLQGRGLWGWLGADPTEANGPRGLAVVGSKAYTAVYFSDRVGVVDLTQDTRRCVSLIDLGPKPKMSPQRLGEMHFHDAWLCFQHWQSCASCHPDARVDGLNWDLLNDGMGNPKNAKSLLLAHDTPPAMALGVRSTAEDAVRSGFTHILFRVLPDEIMDSIDEYLKSLTPVPSPALVNGQLSEAAQRGKEVFSRVGCATCHPEPLYTDLRSHNVGSKGEYDRNDTFDTPTLVECWRTAPYMHDGHFTDLRELIATGKHGLRGEDAKSLTDQELDDLVEYVRSL